MMGVKINMGGLSSTACRWGRCWFGFTRVEWDEGRAGDGCRQGMPRGW